MPKNKGTINRIDDPSSDVAISVSHVSKSFQLPHNKQSSIKGALINLIGGGDRTFETQEVLKDVSFEIKKGEFFGIVGRNGSGKSTLLKMLAGIYKPTQGDIVINGSLTPFIELGVGFNPELTGRENVYLNGALLGFNDKEVDGMYNDIVGFAELERFMDQKLKNYSSGMQVRLAFSIAIRARSDILLLDEVLAVGDEAFQRKCNDYFETLKRNKKTVILVTHDMHAVEKYCTRAMMIQDGDIMGVGKPADIALKYAIANNPNKVTKFSRDDKELPFSIKIGSGEEDMVLTTGDKMPITLSWDYPDIIGASITIFRQSGEKIFWTGTTQDGLRLEKNTKSVQLSLKANLGEGTYYVAASLWKYQMNGAFSVITEGPKFIVNQEHGNAHWEGITYLEHEWRKDKR